MSIFFPFFFFVCLLNFKQQFLRENCFVVKKKHEFFSTSPTEYFCAESEKFKKFV